MKHIEIPRITLEQLGFCLFATGSNFSMMYVFDNEQCWDDFCCGNESVDILFTVCSCNKMRTYLQEKYCKAFVIGFCAIARGRLAVWIDTEKGDDVQ